MARAIAIKGFTVKGGKIVKGERHLSVSERLRQRGSKRVKVAKRGQAR